MYFPCKKISCPIHPSLQEELIPYRVSAFRVDTRSDTYILILHNSFFLEYILLSINVSITLMLQLGNQLGVMLTIYIQLGGKGSIQFRYILLELRNK